MLFGVHILLPEGEGSASSSPSEMNVPQKPNIIV